MSVVLFKGPHHLDSRALGLIDAANDGTDDELISSIKLAQWLGVSRQWCDIGRHQGYGPPYVRLSPRRIRYRVGDVKKWLAERAHRRTAEYCEPKPRQVRVRL